MHLVVADAVRHHADLLELQVEYLTWVFAGVEQHFQVPADAIMGMPVRDYAVSHLDKVCGDTLPQGVFYLAYLDKQLAAMGGFRTLAPGVAEIKRVYCRPQFRGMQLGGRLLAHLLSDAQAAGFSEMCLDTGPFMASAHRLYEAHGFSDCAGYAGTEVPPEFHPRWRFMRRAL